MKKLFEIEKNRNCQPAFFKNESERLKFYIDLKIEEMQDVDFYDLCTYEVKDSKTVPIVEMNCVQEAVLSHLKIFGVYYKDENHYLKEVLRNFAFYFRRETGQSVPQYKTKNYYEERYSQKFLFSTQIKSKGIFIGGCSFDKKDYKDIGDCWTLSWIWIHPFFRNFGFFKALDTFFMGRFPGYVPEPPLSKTMQYYITKYRPDLHKFIINDKYTIPKLSLTPSPEFIKAYLKNKKIIGDFEDPDIDNCLRKMSVFLDEMKKDLPYMDKELIYKISQSVGMIDYRQMQNKSVDKVYQSVQQDLKNLFQEKNLDFEEYNLKAALRLEDPSSESHKLSKLISSFIDKDTSVDEVFKKILESPDRDIYLEQFEKMLLESGIQAVLK